MPVDRSMDGIVPKVILSMIEEARAGRQMSHIIKILFHSLGQAVPENIRFSASVLALPVVGPILPALN